MDDVALLPLKLILSLVNEWKTTSLVCKRWHNVTPEHIISLSPSLSSTGLAEVQPLIRRALRVEFVRCKKIEDAHLAAVLSQAMCTNLNLDSVPAGPRTTEAIGQLSRLKALRLRQCNDLSASFLFHIAQLPKLEMLWVQSCKRSVSLRGISVLSRSSAPLVDLELDLPGASTRDFGDSACAALGQLTTLEALRLHGVCATAHGATALSGLSRLTRLHLVGNGFRINPADPPRVSADDAAALALCPLTQLKSIDLSGASTLTEIGVRALVKHVPQLQVVKLNECRMLDDVCMGALGMLDNLEVLWCGGLTNRVTDRGIVALTGLSKLDDLHLAMSHCSPMAFESLRPHTQLTALTVERCTTALSATHTWWFFAKNFDKLVHLQVMDTFIGAQELALISCMTQLNCLHLHVVDIDNESAQLLCSRLYDLHHLELHGGRMAESALAEFAGLSKLEALSLSHFDELSSQSFEPFRTRMFDRTKKRLTMLEIAACPDCDLDTLSDIADEVIVSDDLQ